MKNKMVILLVMLVAFLVWLNVGCYKTYFAEDNQVVFFVKKHLSFQVRYENIYLTDENEKPLGRLNDEERGVVISYCKYRLGIETQLRTQEELDACKQR